MARTIDYDRGCIIKTIASLGMDVFMYRDDPGVFLTAKGQSVPPALAQQAGFDTERLERMRVRKLRIAQATEAVNSELDLADSDNSKRVVKTFGEFQVVVLGRSGRYQVEDTAGDTLTPGQVLSEEMATSVAMALAGVTKETLPTPTPKGRPATPPPSK